MKKTYLKVVLILSVILLSQSIVYAKQDVFKLPEFTQTSIDKWINSPPLSVADLKGKVVLVDIWTYACWNCYRSIPWLRSLEERFSSDEFIIIGIHTPEFEHEYVRKNVVAKTKEFNVTHPVMMDNDFAYWKALNNRYWPTFYIVDKSGTVRGKTIGETHEGDARARQMEQLIGQLLEE